MHTGWDTLQIYIQLYIMCRLQQELLAKMISDLCPTEVEEELAPGLPHFVDEDSIESEVEDKEQSMFGRLKLALMININHTFQSS